MTIPIITRTNTIDEWRIQTNLSAIDLNNLKANNYTKSNGTLTLSGNSSIILTGPGTVLQTSNNALIGNDLSVANNFTVGTVGSNVGNVSIGNTLTVAGRNTGLSVSNSAIINKDLNIVGNVFANYATVNTNATIGNNVAVAGVVTLSGTGRVLSANSGTVYVKDAYLANAFLTTANVTTINALEAFIDNLSDIGSIVTNILRATTGNVYYLSSDTSYANTGRIKDFVANNSANLVNLTSNVSTINTATIGNLLATNGTIISGNVVTLTSNVATLNTSTLINSTLTNTAIANAVITTATITTGNIITSRITNGTIVNGNVVTLTSNVATLNNSTLLSTQIASATIATANVTSNLNLQNATLKVNTGVNQDAIIIESGTTTLQGVVIEGNLTVSGSFTQTGNLNFEIDQFVLNANTGTNKDGLIVNDRTSGNDAIIKWNETNDRWEISTGNTWTTTYKILDGADIYTGVNSTSDVLVASASAVKFAYEAGGVIAGGYANAAYRHANSAYLSQNTTGIYANSAYIHANAAFVTANTPTHVANSASSYANGAFARANTANNLAQIAYDTANTALIAGGQIAGSYANSAFLRANAAFAGTTGTHSNSAYATANTALVDAALADQKAVSANTNATIAGSYANGAFAVSNTANLRATSSGVYANAAFAAANTKLDTSGGTINGDLTITGTLNAAGASIYANELKVADAVITLNADINQSASPVESAGIEVDRGTSANVQLLWNETTDKWTFTNNGVDYQNIAGANDVTTQLQSYLPLAGGTLTGTLVLAGAPTSPLHAATKAYVDQSISSGGDLSNLNASNLTSGTVPSARLSGSYAINISGTAASATTAGSATTASSATTAGTATSLNGGQISAATGYQQLSGSFKTYVMGEFLSGGTGTSTPALKVLGDVAATGNMYATTFIGNLTGTASAARYADLAEKYIADDEYSEGTVLAVGGKKEVTAATDLHFRPLGVVSNYPAYLMNSDLKNGTVVALKGRVPVRVIGKVKKGQPLGPSNVAGLAKYTEDKYFAIALKSKTTEEEGIIEAVIL
jgi:hypothetical protein